MEFTACQGALMPEEALTSFTVCDAYCYLDATKSRHAKNILYQQIKL